MTARNYGVRDVVVEHPGLDHLVGLFAVGVWAAALRGVDVEYVPEFLVGLATVSALVLTAATFVCSLTYQSTAQRVIDLRVAYGVPMQRNWVSIFAITFASALLPLVALLLVGAGPIGPALAVWSATMLTLKAARTLYWLKAMVFMHHMDDVRPKVDWPLSRTEIRSA